MELSELHLRLLGSATMKTDWGGCPVLASDVHHSPSFHLQPFAAEELIQTEQTIPQGPLFGQILQPSAE
eukprot:2292668-Amphidinium_carterae.1